MTDTISSLITGNTGSSSSARSAIGVYSDMASYTNALEKVQQKIDEEAALVQPNNTDWPTRVSSWNS
jgi:hypothetical protein